MECPSPPLPKLALVKPLEREKKISYEEIHTCINYITTITLFIKN